MKFSLFKAFRLTSLYSWTPTGLSADIPLRNPPRRPRLHRSRCLNMMLLDGLAFFESTVHFSSMFLHVCVLCVFCVFVFFVFFDLSWFSFFMSFHFHWSSFSICPWSSISYDLLNVTWPFLIRFLKSLLSFNVIWSLLWSFFVNRFLTFQFFHPIHSRFLIHCKSVPITSYLCTS